MGYRAPSLIQRVGCVHLLLFRGRVTRGHWNKLMYIFIITVRIVVIHWQKRQLYFSNLYRHKVTFSGNGITGGRYSMSEWYASGHSLIIAPKALSISLFQATLSFSMITFKGQFERTIITNIEFRPNTSVGMNNSYS